MNKKLLFLTKASLAKKTKSKWFKIINLLLLILIVGVINIDSIITFFGGDFNQKLEIIVIDHTNEVSETFKMNLKSSEKALDKDPKIEVKTTKESRKEIEKKIGDKVLIIFDSSHNDFLKAQVISDGAIESNDYQLITTALSTTKYNYGLAHSNINPEELEKISSPIKIDRVILDKEKNSDSDNMDMIMGTVFPTIILPFFMLIIFLVQMIGSEIYEEKSTRSMEVIISNVSPKTHFLSKMFSANIFAITQGLLLLIYGVVGLLIRGSIGNSSAVTSLTSQISDIWELLVKSGFVEKLSYIIPLTLVLLVLSFFAYSLIAGILASMTVNMDDYQQIQSPIMLILVVAYYLAIMASMFHGSLFIRILSYLPFISCLLSPALLVLGQVSILDITISIILLLLFNIIVMKSGLRIYKEGILNYSSEKVWRKIKQTLKNSNKN